MVTLSYTVQSQTIFSGVLKTPSMGIYGTSTAQASVPPNIDFYLLLDNSPSMSLPATSAGVTAMQRLTFEAGQRRVAPSPAIRPAPTMAIPRAIRA